MEILEALIHSMNFTIPASSPVTRNEGRIYASLRGISDE